MPKVIVFLFAAKIEPDIARPARSAGCPTRLLHAGSRAQRDAPAATPSHITQRQESRIHKAAARRRRRTKWKSFRDDAFLPTRKRYSIRRTPRPPRTPRKWGAGIAASVVPTAV